MKRFFALTTLFSIYIFPASVRATITPIQLNYETVGIPKEETKSFSKDNSSDLISKKSAKPARTRRLRLTFKKAQRPNDQTEAYS